MSRKPRRVGGLTTFVVTLVILGLIAASGYMIWLCIDLVNKDAPTAPTHTVDLPAEVTAAPTETTVPPTTEFIPEPEKVIATATISAQGDLLMHKPVFDTCLQSDGTYSFDSIFRYMTDTLANYDYSMANLETTFGGDNYKYQGNPEFNCPDPLAADVKEAGYDMLLTANNHSADTRADGIVRTVEVVREAGLATLGTQLNDQEPKYAIVDVNGIKIGMVCYTYAYSHDGTNFSLNGLLPIKDVGTVNFFMNNNLDKLYNEVQAIKDTMDAEGAEVTMMFIHWGVEYQTTENGTQNKIAQKLCDMGFDVIVGGHPHVVQPVRLIESTVDPDHKTICMYSLGNAVSNQRTGYSKLFPAGYTEDGAMFTVTFEKYSDGEVYVAATDVIPTWVNMHTTGDNPKQYNILPLATATMADWKENFDLTDGTIGLAQNSYDRTMGIVGEGLAQCQEHLAQEKAYREQYYLEKAYDPTLVYDPTPNETVMDQAA